MPYVQRNGNSAVVGLYACLQEGYAEEWLADDDAEVVAFRNPPPGDTSHINGGKLIRFTGVVPVTILENTGLSGATRVAKGRYRVNFGTALDTSSYSILPAYFDATNIRVIRPSARTATYAEVRVTDLAGVAQDVAEITVEIKRVVNQ